MLDPEIEQPPTDEDRTRVIEALRIAGPRLGLEEVDRRMDAAVNARSLSELALLVWDLPAADKPVPTRRAPVGVLRNVFFRFHAAAYAGVNGMLIGIWGITGGTHEIFWPFFPIAGWGIGLGMHGLAVHAGQKHQQEREARRLATAHSRPPALGSGQMSRSRPQSRSGVSRTNAAVMFTDMVDSTRLAVVLGDEDWIRVRNRYRDMLHDCYASHRGADVNSQGDGFLARFPSAATAVQCAIDIQDRLDAQRDQVGFAPSVRIGINLGEAVDNDGDLLGTVVNVAARVMTQAQPNEILVTEAVADRLDDRFQLEDGGLRDLKGLDRTCHVFAVNRK